MIAAEELSRLYQAKRGFFSAELAASRGELTRLKLQQCVQTVDLCWQTFLALGERAPQLPRYLEYQIAAAQLDHDTMVNRMEVSFELIDGLADEDDRVARRAEIKAMAEQHNKSQNVRFSMADLTAKALSTCLEAASSALPVLLKSLDYDEVQQAIQTQVLTLLGLLPGIDVMPAANDLNSLMNMRKKNRNSTAVMVDPREDFLKLAQAWCTATELLVQIIIRLETTRDIDYSISYEDVSAHVLRRYNRLKTHSS
jgi:hypothetical protein